MASRGSHLKKIIFHYKKEELYFQIKKEIGENIQYFFKAFSKKNDNWRTQYFDIFTSQV